MCLRAPCATPSPGAPGALAVGSQGYCHLWPGAAAFRPPAARRGSAAVEPDGILGHRSAPATPARAAIGSGAGRRDAPVILPIPGRVPSVKGPASGAGCRSGDPFGPSPVPWVFAPPDGSGRIEVAQFGLVHPVGLHHETDHRVGQHLLEEVVREGLAVSLSLATACSRSARGTLSVLDRPGCADRG
jgi:hypothetical protein